MTLPQSRTLARRVRCSGANLAGRCTYGGELVAMSELRERVAAVYAAPINRRGRPHPTAGMRAKRVFAGHGPRPVSSRS